ncbi:MAG: hypothetical protein IKT61_04765 [Clostridia bacterium]|nr:hypothetical protein [Clostridia bacterium]
MVGAVCIWFLIAFFGNPVSEFLLKQNAKEYLAENWPDSEYIIESVGYDFKTSNYYAEVSLPGSMDNNFTIYGGFNGKISFDTYEDSVVKRRNTAGRIGDEYRETVDKVFDGGTFGYTSDISFGDIEFADSDYAEDESVPDYAIYTETLIPDAEYDVYDMGRKAGCLTVYVYDDDVSVEKLAEVLLELKVVMDNEHVGFRAVNCVLEHPKGENGVQSASERVEVIRFAYDDIYENGLPERVSKAYNSAKEYYAQQSK